MPAAVPTSPARSAALVLGLLRLGARSGYDVKRVAAFSIRHFWALSYAQIYPLLKRLTAEELIEVAGTAEPRGRREHHLTDAGEAALIAWLTSPDDLAYELRDEGVLKLFFADALDREQQLALVAALRKRAEDMRDTLSREAVEPGEALLQATGNRFPLVTAQLGVAIQAFIAERAATLEAELRRG